MSLTQISQTPKTEFFPLYWTLVFFLRSISEKHHLEIKVRLLAYGSKCENQSVALWALYFFKINFILDLETSASPISILFYWEYFLCIAFSLFSFLCPLAEIREWSYSKVIQVSKSVLILGQLESRDLDLMALRTNLVHRHISFSPWNFLKSLSQHEEKHRDFTQ